MPNQKIERAISICAPWSWLVVSGPQPGFAWKPVENRSWPASYVGPLAIQESTSKRNFTPDTENFICDAHPQIEAALEDDRIEPSNPLFHFGSIIGAVTCIGSVAYDPATQDFGAVCRAAGFGDWYDRQCRPGFPPPDYWAEGPCCHLYESPIQFTVPIPAKGKLNIYRLAPEEIAAVNRALSAPHGSPVEYRAKLKAAGIPPKPAKAKAAGKPAAKAAKPAAKTKSPAV